MYCQKLKVQELRIVRYLTETVDSKLKKENSSDKHDEQESKYGNHHDVHVNTYILNVYIKSERPLQPLNKYLIWLLHLTQLSF